MIQFELDPTGHYAKTDPPVPHHRLAEMCGIIPDWLSAWDAGQRDRYTTLQDYLQVAYAHGGGWHHSNQNWSLSDDGVLTWKDDGEYEDETEREPDDVMPPFLRCGTPTEQTFIYPHAWVVIKTSEGFEVSRMD